MPTLSHRCIYKTIGKPEAKRLKKHRGESGRLFVRGGTNREEYDSIASTPRGHQHPRHCAMNLGLATERHQLPFCVVLDAPELIPFSPHKAIIGKLIDAAAMLIFD